MKRAKSTYLGCKARLFMGENPVPRLHACRLKYIGPGKKGFELYKAAWICDALMVAPQLTHVEITDDKGCLAHALIRPVDVADISPTAICLTVEIGLKHDPTLAHGEYLVHWPDSPERRKC